MQLKLIKRNLSEIFRKCHWQRALSTHSFAKGRLLGGSFKDLGIQQKAASVPVC